MALQGFDKDYYLGQKLAQLQADFDEWADKDQDFLEDVMAFYGLTAEEHYTKHGRGEGLAPNAYFDAEEYVEAKAQQMFDQANYYSAVEAKEAFFDVWGDKDPYVHYLNHGAAEGVNPSNDFDNSKYEDALAAMGEDLDGLTPLGHFIANGDSLGIDASDLVVPEDDAVDVGGEGTVETGESFYLDASTNRGEDFTGTKYNDTFNAWIEQNDYAGGVSNSLSSADRLDGGAGYDTLNAELVNEFVGASGEQQESDVQPKTTSIEEIKIEARDENTQAATLDAKYMTGIEKIGSFMSDGDLVIENLTTLSDSGAIRHTSEMTVTMDHTDNFNSDGDASDLTVYFDEDYLNTTTSTQGSTLTVKVNNVYNIAEGLNPVENFSEINFTVGETAVAVDISGATSYDDIVTAINDRLTELDLTNVTAAKAAEENAYFSMDIEGYSAGELAGPFNPIVITNTGSETLTKGSIELAQGQSDGDINNTWISQDAEQTTNPISINVELDKVGRDGEGGNLVIGGKNNDDWGDTDVDQNDGINIFNIAVKGDDDRPSNLGTIASTNNSLFFVNVAGTDGADLTVRDMLGEGQELQSINATGFSGDFSLGMSGPGQQAMTSSFGSGDDSYNWMSNEFMNEQINATTPFSSQEYTIDMGAGDDELTAALDGNSVDTAGESFSVDMGSGDDDVTVTMSDGVSQDTMAELGNLTIELGSNNDTLNLNAYGNFQIDAGAGQDFVRINSTGDNGDAEVGFWVFGDNSVSQTGNSFAGGAARVLYKAELTVSFAGFEATVDVDTDSTGNFLASQTNINAAIKEAIEGDRTLNSLLTVQEGNFEQLIVTSNVGGDNQLAIDLFQPELVDSDPTDGEQVVIANSSDQSALVKGLVATNGINAVDTDNVAEADVISDVNDLGVGSLKQSGAEVNGTVDYNVAADDHYNTDSDDANAYQNYTDRGGSNDGSGINFSTIKAGSDEDVVVFHSNEASSNTLDLNNSFDHIDVVNFHNVSANEVDDAGQHVGFNALDFTGLLTDKTSDSGSDESEVAVNITLNVEETTLGTALNNPNADTTDTDLAQANSVNILGFDEEVHDDSITFDEITLSNLVAQLNDDTADSNEFGDLDGTDLDADDAPANFVGTTQNHIIMVENNQNPGEYKVFHVTSTVDADGNIQDDGDFTGQTELGTLDFGASINFALAGNDDYKALKAALIDHVDTTAAGNEFVFADAGNKYDGTTITPIEAAPVDTTGNDMAANAAGFSTQNSYNTTYGIAAGTNIDYVNENISGEYSTSGDDTLYINDDADTDGSILDLGNGTGDTLSFAGSDEYDITNLAVFDGVEIIDATDATTLTATAAQIDGVTVNNGTTVDVTAGEGDLAADFSNIAADTVTLVIDTAGGVTFTGDFGTADVTLDDTTDAPGDTGALTVAADIADGINFTATGSETLTVTAAAGDQTITGTANGDTITGGAGTNTYNSSDGADTYVGTSGETATFNYTDATHSVYNTAVVDTFDFSANTSANGTVDFTGAFDFTDTGITTNLGLDPDGNAVDTVDPTTNTATTIAATDIFDGGTQLGLVSYDEDGDGDADFAHVFVDINENGELDADDMQINLIGIAGNDYTAPTIDTDNNTLSF